MPSKLERILPKFKGTQLKQLAFLCGAKSSGKKSEMVERLARLAKTQSDSQAAGKEKLVLSIDLGIRNLGFALLTPDASARPSGLPSTAPELRQPSRVNLQAWRRRELLEVLPDAPTDPERFSPASLAVAADRLVRRDFLPLGPTHVLIERQRWRSGGGSAVQEWTLRVNTLEAMLHASLRTMRELGQWSGDVASVAPDRVTRFWPAPAPADDVIKTRSTKAVVQKEGKGAKSQLTSKKHKIGVLASWLAKGHGGQVIIPANGGAEDAVRQYRARLPGAPRRRSGKGDQVRDPGDRKLDDLTDCLLQAVAWLKWQENSELLLDEDWIEELLELDLLDQDEANTILDDV
ncbi:Ydc2-catalyt-domain-containing protein [Jackrogersella minutella]|nr:Ydc2-catalyt-domain-containing protein [Jackrogersella minutella]